jgi:hypothetical protein
MSVTGCRKTEVGAFAVFRGVKCCCSVENAGRAGFLGSSSGVCSCLPEIEGLSEVPVDAATERLLGASGLTLVLVVRFNASSLAEVRAGANVVSVEGSPVGFVARPGATINDLGLSARLTPSVCGLRAFVVD